ncbi:peptidase inhibitor family I36 protein [Micromonospora sp. NPDC023956]|uniref:peptidase inhibitor family I36 protein n=1 Tax=Micromonospora sp. NPDC023956 TaxID=3155722 RepID=UPI0033CBF617
MLLLSFGTASPSALASPSDQARQQRIEAHLKAYPGGIQINANEISYAGRSFVMSFERSVRSLQGADCPSGMVCYYEGRNFGYPRGRYSGCSWLDLASLGWNDRMESVHYNAPTGTAYFWNHGSVDSHAYDSLLFRYGTGNRIDADLSPNLNKADHVERRC